MKKFVSSLILFSSLIVLSGCSKNSIDDKTIIVGASPSPHAQILEQIKDDVSAKGYTLEIVEFSDYYLPNIALQSGEIDANYFQHLPYLLDFNKNNNTDLVSVFALHFEPLGIYSSKHLQINNIEYGSKIAIPNDTSNEARALLLLEANNLITLKNNAGFETSLNDIEDNPYGIIFSEIEAVNLPNILPDVDYAIINGNYAIDAGILDKVILTESTESEAALTRANIIAVKNGNQEKEAIKVLIECLATSKVKKYIEETFGSSVIPVF
ncbi:MAG: MetQ/NlpA family ABC transporter substrate-binding protein [Bacilli bacterium]|nr:MetQ/NlpA family ABC transporter substrate-binding protein [Bacilli bacterium]